MSVFLRLNDSGLLSAMGGFVLAMTMHLTQPPMAAAEGTPETLRQAAGNAFLIGTAVRPDQLQQGRTATLIGEQFDSLTAENVLKPMELEPQPGKFNFAPADVIADYAAAHQMQLIGHNLCWHQQTPAWFYQKPDGSPLSREEGLAHMKAHITAVVQHFKGKVHGWDVVNEALDDNDANFLRDTPARRSIGDDYIVQAFKFAHAADPDVQLYYNDYNIDFGAKLAKAVRLIKQLQAAGVRIDGIGDQAHWQLGWPSTDLVEKGITTLAATGVKVHITEMDIDMLPRRSNSANISDIERKAATARQNPYANGLPPQVQQALADRYGELFALFMKHKDIIARVTLWGVDDGASWLNDFPVRGRTNYPLLFDRQDNPKPAFFAVLQALQDGQTGMSSRNNNDASPAADVSADAHVPGTIAVK